MVISRYALDFRARGVAMYGLDFRASYRAAWPGFPGQDRPGFPGHPGLDFQAGILFLFFLSGHLASIVLKLHPVPFQVVLRRHHHGAAVTAAWRVRFGQSPMRRLTLAVDAEASIVGFD